jgi:hypothetical protein
MSKRPVSDDDRFYFDLLRQAKRSRLEQEHTARGLDHQMPDVQAAIQVELDACTDEALQLETRQLSQQPMTPSEAELVRELEAETDRNLAAKNPRVWSDECEVLVDETGDRDTFANKADDVGDKPSPADQPDEIEAGDETDNETDENSDHLDSQLGTPPSFQVGAHVKIPLRNIKGDVVDYAIVSACDAEAVNKHSWHMRSGGYAQATISHIDEAGIRRIKHTRMHYFIADEMGLKPTSAKQKVLDHILGGGLINTRENLRWATRRVNGHNMKKRGGCKSQYRGVAPSPSTKGVWTATIRNGLSEKISASFRSEQAAAWWWDKQAVALHGTNASHLNKVEKPANYDSMVIKASKWSTPEMRNIKQKGDRFILLINHKRHYFTKLADAQKTRDD